MRRFLMLALASLFVASTGTWAFAWQPLAVPKRGRPVIDFLKSDGHKSKLDKRQLELQKDVSSFKPAKSKDGPKLTGQLNNLALEYQALGDFKQAERLFLQAIDIGKATKREKHADHGVVLNNLGVLHQEWAITRGPARCCGKP